MKSDEYTTHAAQHPGGVDASDAALEKQTARHGRTRKAPSEAIHCKRFIRRLQTDNVLTALMAFSDRDLQADLQTWNLACEVYTTEQLQQIFDELVQSGSYSFGRLTEELMGSFDRLRDPDPDMDYPSVAAACTAVKREARARMAKGDHHWARLDPETGRSPHQNEGRGWEAMTVALFDRMLSDKLPRALDMRFAGDLGL